jgi:hypothetical protein
MTTEHTDPNHDNLQATPPRQARAGGGTAALWASAALILALIIIQAGRLPALDPAANAAMVSQSGQYTVLTFNGGNEDIVAVLDGRGEELFLYQVRTRSKLEFVGREDLRTLFSTARTIGASKK